MKSPRCETLVPHTLSSRQKLTVFLFNSSKALELGKPEEASNPKAEGQRYRGSMFYSFPPTPSTSQKDVSTTGADESTNDGIDNELHM